MRIVGLDVGTKTVGVAISDEMGWTAQGLETIAIDEEKNQLGMKQLDVLLKPYKVDKFVVGLPKNMNGTIGPRGEDFPPAGGYNRRDETEKVSKHYAEKLEKRYKVPVVLWDERLTTMAAERVLLDADVSRKKRKKVIDKMAAVLILQGYLDSGKL